MKNKDLYEAIVCICFTVMFVAVMTIPKCSTAQMAAKVDCDNNLYSPSYSFEERQVKIDTLSGDTFCVSVWCRNVSFRWSSIGEVIISYSEWKFREKKQGYAWKKEDYGWQTGSKTN